MKSSSIFIVLHRYKLNALAAVTKDIVPRAQPRRLEIVSQESLIDLNCERLRPRARGVQRNRLGGTGERVASSSPAYAACPRKKERVSLSAAVEPRNIHQVHRVTF